MILKKINNRFINIYIIYNNNNGKNYNTFSVI